jgi:Tol biopolymer transport system component
MPLAPGQRLGPYVIVGVVGAGGMGEVYRARDERLGREVAIKVLPDAVRDDVERLRRFEREARAASALNHPAILAVHDFEPSGPTPYLVAELLDGATLRDHLDGRPLPIAEALDLGTQLARGLAAAHARGILHRDIKPDNVFVTRDGRLKILDFGLAKEVAAPGAEGTLAEEGTATGAILGTAGYMSPEQVRGAPADQRSDLFSVGATLYEMLSGRKAFDGETPVERAYAVLKDDPPDLVARHGVPSAVAAVVRRCLQKRAEDRIASASELAMELEALASRKAAPAADRPAFPARKRPILRVATLALAAAAGLVGAFFLGKRAAPGPLPLDVSATIGAQHPAIQRLTFRLGAVNAARFSDDGHAIVYSAAFEGESAQIFIGSPGAPEARGLTPPRTDLLAVSPVSAEMAMATRIDAAAGHGGDGNRMSRRPLGEGAPREMMDDVIAADFAPDGVAMAVARRVGTRQRLEYPVGKVLVEQSEVDGFISALRVSPRGASVAYVVLRGPTRGEIRIVSADGQSRLLVDKPTRANASWGIAWSPSGDEIWFTVSEIGKAPSLEAISLAGKERLILEELGSIVLQDIARDGRVLLTLSDQRLKLCALPPGETQERNLSWFYGAQLMDLSRDGKQILFLESGEAALRSTMVAYLRKTDGSPPIRLGDGLPLALSPDGQWVLYCPQGRCEEPVLLPTGAGEPRPLAKTALGLGDARYFPDGKRILVRAREASSEVFRLFTLDVQSGALTPEGREALGGFGEPIAPDGQKVAALDADEYPALFPVGGGESRPIAGLDRGDQPIEWTPDGSALFVYQESRDLPVSIYRYEFSTRKKALWKVLAPADPGARGLVGRLRMTPDGKAYAYVYERYLSDLYLVDGLH